MDAGTNTYGLTWDFVIPDSLSASQRWVLSAMRSYGPGLVTMLWRILGNEQDVCDAYQDTFLKLAHHNRDRKPLHVKAYLFRSASNVAISILRHRAVERAGLRSGRPDTPVRSGPNELDCRDLQQRLRFHIARLPEHLRNVVVLRDLAELPYRRVAKTLHITEPTARVYRCKAIRLLAAWMNREQ